MINIGAISYGCAVAAFALLTLLLSVGWQGRAQGLRFIAAAAGSMVWALVLMIDAWRNPVLNLQLALPMEFLRNALWLVALASIATGVVPRFLLMLTYAAAALLVVVAGVVSLPGVSLSADGWLTLLELFGLGVASLVLVLVEHVYRNANAAGRYGFKLLAIGLGGAYVYDLFLYSQATLLGGVGADFWNARGLLNAVLVPFIAVAARRNPSWSLDVFVSRQVVVVSTAVVSVGAYLLLMSAGGFYVRRVGGSWGGVANTIFVAGALVVLATVIMSGAARRRLQVFLHKHFYRNKFDYRVEWLRFVSTLSAPAQEDIRETSLKAMAQVFQSPGGVLFARAERDGRFEAVAAWPLPVRDVRGLQSLPAGEELLQFMRSTQWVVDLDEYSRLPEIYHNMAVPEWLRKRSGARVISPLLQDSELEGFVLLDEPPPPFELTYEDRDLLKIMGRHVSLILTRNAAERRLTESRQFEAYNRLTAFMMHDLKNAIAQLNLVVSNAQRHRNNPRFVDDAFETVANAAARMTGLMEQLRRPEQPGPREELDLREAVQEAVRRCSDRSPVPQLVPSPAEGSIRLRAERARLINVLEHVLRNAQDASPADSLLEVRIIPDARGVTIEVQDQGSGMSAEFVRDRLFRPFDSTKGAKGMGIGAYQVLEYVRLLGGDVEVRTSPGKGSTFGIKLPLLGG